MCHVTQSSREEAQEDIDNAPGTHTPDNKDESISQGPEESHQRGMRKSAQAHAWAAALQAERREREIDSRHRDIAPPPRANQRAKMASRWTSVVSADDQVPQRTAALGDSMRASVKERRQAYIEETQRSRPIQRETNSSSITASPNLVKMMAATIQAPPATPVNRMALDDSVRVSVSEKKEAFIEEAQRPTSVERAVNVADITVPPKMVKKVTCRIETDVGQGTVLPESVEPPAPKGQVAVLSALANLQASIRQASDDLDATLGCGFAAAAVRITRKANPQRLCKKAPTIPLIGPLNAGRTSILELLTADDGVLPVTNVATTCGVVTLLPSKDDKITLVEIHDLHDGSTPYERVIAEGREKARAGLQKHFDEQRAASRQADEAKREQEIERLTRNREAVMKRDKRIYERDKLMGRVRDEIIIDDVQEEGPPDLSEETLVLEAAKGNRCLGVRLPFKNMPGDSDDLCVTLQDTGACNELGSAHAAGAVMEAILSGDGLVWVESKSSAATGSGLKSLAKIRSLRPDILDTACKLVRVIITRCDDTGMGETPQEELASIIQAHWRSIGCELPRENIVFLSNGDGRKRLAELARMAKAPHTVPTSLSRRQKRLLKACSKDLPEGTTDEDRLLSSSLQEGIDRKLETMGVKNLIVTMHELAVALHDVAALDPVTAASSALRVLKRPLECAQIFSDAPAVSKVLKHFQVAEAVVARTVAIL